MYLTSLDISLEQNISKIGKNEEVFKRDLAGPLTPNQSSTKSIALRKSRHVEANKKRSICKTVIVALIKLITLKF